ncbi:50S ribosomal protein L6 [Candidatus Parcubacteria bacterium]|nr:50S ribosomal protein L6 [Candidatus Parcubacteria bacterium]
MSRIGKKPIEIPDKVEIKIESQKVIVKGPKGELFRVIPNEIKVDVKDGKVFVATQLATKKAPALWGLIRALIANMLIGVTDGFQKELEIQGIGYQASLEGSDLVLKVGFSHSVKVDCPEGIEFLVNKNIISIKGIDKGLVGQVAANIRKIRPPEPYKGKGIRYVGEIVRRKVGKKAATAE